MSGFRGYHVLALVAIVLAAIAVRATEVYTSRYQTLPVLDWLGSRPPLAESARVPAASDLARGFTRALPLLVIRDDARSHLPAFSPPAAVQQTVGGVRDASRIVLGTPGDYPSATDVPVIARLDVIVFDRAQRAAAWSDLMSRAMNIRDVEDAMPQVRIAGPDEAYGVWMPLPGPQRGGVATVAGFRGTVGFDLKLTYLHSDDTDVTRLADLSARAESLARQAITDWSAWLADQLSAL